jgi:hypothetical protein
VLKTLLGKKQGSAPAVDVMARYYRIRRFDDGAIPIHVIMSVDPDGTNERFMLDGNAQTYWSISEAHLRAMASEPRHHLIEYTEG